MKPVVWASIVGGGLALAAWSSIATTPRQAREAARLTPTQLQTQVEPVVRNYLVNNPQVIAEAMQRMQQMEMEQAIARIRPELERPFPGAVMGNPDGDVTIVEFSDYRCPYCRQAHAALAAAIERDPGIRVVVREIPILDRGSDRLSRRAAEAALAAARQGRYGAFRDALYSVQGRLGADDIVSIVRSLRLDERRIAADMNSGEVAAELQRSAMLAQAIGVTGTPAYIIGNHAEAGLLTTREFLMRAREARSKAS